MYSSNLEHIAITQFNQKDWTPIGKDQRSSKINPDKISINISDKKYKEQVKSRIMIYVGRNIEKSLQLEKDNRLMVSSHNNNPYMLILQHSTKGRKIYGKDNGGALYVWFHMPDDMLLRPTSTTPINYHYISNVGIIIDLSKFKR
jgi:hypothetical protein